MECGENFHTFWVKVKIGIIFLESNLSKCIKTYQNDIKHCSYHNLIILLLKIYIGNNHICAKEKYIKIIHCDSKYPKQFKVQQSNIFIMQWDFTYPLKIKW